jgi:hypothetical protein
VAEAIVPNGSVFLTTEDRGESEVVLDPRRLRGLRVEVGRVSMQRKQAS